MTNKNDSVRHDRFGAASKDEAKGKKAKKKSKSAPKGLMEDFTSEEIANQKRKIREHTQKARKKPALEELHKAGGGDDAGREVEKALAQPTNPNGSSTTRAKALAQVLDGTLLGIAKEINARLEKASTADGKARDHRLAAAILLSEAKADCQKNGVDFKQWALAEVKMGWENTRKLVTIGESDDPAKAIEDLRLKQAKRMQVARATPAPEPANNPATSAGPDDTSPVVHTETRDDGIEVTSITEFKPIDLDTVLRMVLQLSLADKISLLKVMAKSLGYTLNDGFEDTPASDDPAAPNPDDEVKEYERTPDAGDDDIPEFLKRGGRP